MGRQRTEINPRGNGGLSPDPRLPAMRSRFAMREWRSRIYAVEFPGTAAASPATGLPALPEVALL